MDILRLLLPHYGRFSAWRSQAYDDAGRDWPAEPMARDFHLLFPQNPPNLRLSE
jgi:hypothetical protein